jgi:hypothetical protein
MAYPFRFGRCITSTYGSVVVDLIDLPHVQTGFSSNDQLIGGSSRALDGTLRTDTIAFKRQWPDLKLNPLLTRAQFWPVKQYYLAPGPNMIYDQTIPSMLTGDQSLMQNSAWTNAAGTVTTARGTAAANGLKDGAVSLAISGVTQLGPTTSPTRTLLVPVVAAQQYFAGCTVVGPGAWAVTVAIGWYDAAGSAALSTSTVASGITTATALSSCYCLDGSVIGYRVGGSATAPAGALYAQIRISTATATADVSDPVMIEGTGDPGNAMTVVQINSIDEIAMMPNIASLSLNLSEV